MRLLLGVCLSLFVTAALGAENGLIGRILDPVASVKTPEQRYVLYVPSTYTAEKKWPVIFCFDPGARGRVPVERLQAAAEKYGYIVAGSLNSRNGPWAANAAAIQAMVADVESHLSIDHRRIYSAGLSGGARVATQVALGGLAKGVIACSAGFPSSEEGRPGRLPFVFFGTAGTDDFNLGELRRLDEELESSKDAHRIVVFHGGHEWASTALMTEAVEWLELQAMRAGTREKDAGWVQAQWDARRAAIPAVAGLERWRGLKSLAADFKGLVETKEIENEAKDLGATREVKDGVKAERTALRKESDLMAELGDFSEGGSTAKMRRLVADLRAKAAAAEDSEDRRIARRVVAGFGSAGRDVTRPLFEQGAYYEAVPILEILVELRPGQSRTLYDLARAQAGLGDRRKALEALAQAAEAGFADATRLEADPLFVKLRQDPAYQSALAKVKTNPPEAPGRGGREFGGR